MAVAASNPKSDLRTKLAMNFAAPLVNFLTLIASPLAPRRCSSLVSQGIDRVQARGSCRWIEAEEYAHQGRYADGQGDGIA